MRKINQGIFFYLCEIFLFYYKVTYIYTYISWKNSVRALFDDREREKNKVEDVLFILLKNNHACINLICNGSSSFEYKSAESYTT